MRASRLVHETITLRDGRSVVLRPIDRTDADGLIELHNNLSFESQYLRFFGPKPRLSHAEAEYLANVDFHQRFAIVAQAQTDDRRVLVAVGRFDINEPGIAEAAIVVRDDHQGIGLGSAILARLREVGRGAGLEAFSAEILAENNRMIELLQANGLEISPAESGVVRVRVPIRDRPLLFTALKVVAGVAGAILQTGRSSERDS